MTSRRSLLLGSGALLAVLTLSPDLVSAAEPRATVSIDVVLASKTPGASDARGEKLKGQLGDFAYQSYQALAEKTASVAKGGTETVELASGKQLKVTFKQVDKDGRVRLKLSVPGVVDTTVSLAPGGSVVLGGPAMPHGDGVLFLPVTLQKLE